MHAIPPLLADLAVVLGTAAVVSAVFHRLKIPPILGYVIAGLLVGPHVPVPLVANQANVQTLSDLGVILLMFTIGLEFNARKLLRAGPRSLLVVAVQGGAAFWMSFMLARAFGWSESVSVFMGAAFCVSSTMIASRLMESVKPEASVRDSVFSVLVIQDLLAILLLTGLGTASAAGGAGGHGGVAQLVWSLLRLLGFASALVVLGLLLVPRFVRWVADRQASEALLVLSVGLCFSLAYLAARVGYSPALGAFLGGMLISESGRSERVERLVHPLRDLFSAVFFVSVGMLMDPRPLPHLVLPVLAFATMVLVATPLGVALASVLGGRTLRTGFQAGFVLAQIGEFSFIMLGLGLSTGAASSESFTTAVAASVLTLAAASYLNPHAVRISNEIDARLPGPVRLHLDAYRHWLEGLDFQRTRTILPAHVRKPLFTLILETTLLVGVLATAFRLLESGSLWLEGREHWPHAAAVLLSWLSVCIIAGLLAWIILRGSRRIAERWMSLVAPDSGRSLESARQVAQRRMFQSAILLALGLPALAALQPFVPPGRSWMVPLAALGIALAWKFRRRRA